MCQAIPRPVLSVSADRAQVLLDGVPTWVDRRTVPDLSVGEYVIVYAGVALEKLPTDEALELLRFYEELEAMLSDGSVLPDVTTSTDPSTSGAPAP